MLNIFKSPPPLKTPEDVRDAIVDRLTKTKRISSVEHTSQDGLDVDVQADGKIHKFFLENAVVAVLNSGESARGQHKTVRTYVDAFLSSLSQPDLVLDQVYPIVRHRGYVDIEGSSPIFTEVGGDLVCALAHDTPQTLVTLNKDMIEEADLAVAEVWGAARVNLSLALKAVEDEDLGAGLHIMRLKDPWLGTSLMLAPDLFHVARQTLSAETLYLAAPSREGIVYIDSAAPGAFVHIQEAVKIGLGQDHPQSEFVFTLAEADESPVPGWRHANGEFRPIS